MSGMFDFFWAPDEGVDVEDVRDIVPYVVERAPGAEPSEVRRALGSAVRQFLIDTGVWRKEDAPAYASLNEVRVGAGGIARIMSIERIVRVSDGAEVYKANSTYTQPGQKKIRDDGAGVFVIAMPGAVDGDEYTADLVVTTKFGGEVCPSWVLQTYGEAIGNKAAHELLTKGKPTPTAYINEYRATVQEILARRAMGGSSKSSQGSALSQSMERM